MAKPKSFHPDTLSLHAGQRPDPSTGARATPIYQTASYVFRDTDHAASIFNIERTGHVYSRISNPTNAVLEERISALEGGLGAIATASGQAAMHLAIATLMGAGSHIVSSQSLYGGTHNLLAYTMPRFGIETTFVDPRDPEAFARAVRPDTRLVFAETLGNPGLEVLDIPRVAEVAHAAGLPLMIDSTFTTPYLCRPFDHGADIVMHSATKFLSGHGVVIGGLLVDGGTFDWESSDRFPTLTEPYEGFHDLDFAEEFGPAAFITRARKEGARDFGACMSAMTSFLILQGLETLPLRMQRHVENTRMLVEFLNQHEAVEWVLYPELPDHPDQALASKLLPKGAGAVFSFGVKGGRKAGQHFIENLELVSHLANIGDAKSLVIHPASTTHHRMDAKALEAAGISEGLVRISVGIENIDDLIEDIAIGLRASQKV
jgi:O-acetylhomoserine (thiol)-lyase